MIYFDADSSCEEELKELYNNVLSEYNQGMGITVDDHDEIKILTRDIHVCKNGVAMLNASDDDAV